MQRTFKYDAMGTHPEALLVNLFKLGLNDKALNQIVYVENHKGWWTVGFSGIPCTALLTVVSAQLLQMFYEVSWDNDRLNSIIFNYELPTQFEFDIETVGFIEAMKCASKHQKYCNDFNHYNIYEDKPAQMQDRYEVESVDTLIRQRRVQKLLDGDKTT